MRDSADLDPTAIDRLFRLGGQAFVAKMIDLFLDYGGQKIAEARAASEAGDLTAVERAVHPLKSSAGNVGAARLQGLAVDAEALAKAGNTSALAARLGELEATFERVKPLLEAAKGRESSSQGSA